MTAKYARQDDHSYEPLVRVLPSPSVFCAPLAHLPRSLLLSGLVVARRGGEKGEERGASAENLNGGTMVDSFGRIRVAT